MVDPADDRLCGVTLFEGVGEAADFLGDADTVAQEFEMAIVTVFGAEQLELVAKREEYIDVVGVVDVPFTRCEFVAEDIDDVS